MGSNKIGQISPIFINSLVHKLIFSKFLKKNLFLSIALEEISSYPIENSEHSITVKPKKQTNINILALISFFLNYAIKM